MVLSPLPEYSFFPTTVRHLKVLVCPCKVVICWCVSVSHTPMVLSPLPEYSLFPSTVRHVTPLVCPCNVAICIPGVGPRSSLNCSFRKDLSSQWWSLNTLATQTRNVYFFSINSLYSSFHSTIPLFIVYAHLCDTLHRTTLHIHAVLNYTPSWQEWIRMIKK